MIAVTWQRHSAAFLYVKLNTCDVFVRTNLNGAMRLCLEGKKRIVQVYRITKELVPFTQLVKVRRGKLVLALPSIRFS